MLLGAPSKNWAKIKKYIYSCMYIFYIISYARKGEKPHIAHNGSDGKNYTLTCVSSLLPHYQNVDIRRICRRLKSRSNTGSFRFLMHNLLKMTCFADICLQRMFFNTLKAETNPKSATNAFVYDKVLLLSSLESTFVAIHGQRRLLWCVLFKCLRCTSNLYLFSITKWSVLFF